MSDSGEGSATPSVDRKADHLRLSLDEDVAHVGITTGLERLRLRARALPDRDLADVDLAAQAWGHGLAAPLLISCMTGGVGEAGPVNQALAAAAQEHGVAFGLGSGRVLLDGQAPAATFQVRDVAPDVLLLANLGAVQLATHGVDGCRRLVETVGADALVLHLNAVQEAVQPGGDTDFGGVGARIAEVCAALPVPVVVKEVGFGMAPEDVAQLVDAGVSGIDVAGAGGTNWARVEGLRDDHAGRVAAAFTDWGWPTVDSLLAARRSIVGSDAMLIASGGIRDGVDVAKALCLGADLVGVARGLLTAGQAGPEAAATAVGVLIDQLRIAVWAVGAAGVKDLNHTRLLGEPPNATTAASE